MSRGYSDKVAGLKSGTYRIARVRFRYARAVYAGEKVKGTGLKTRRYNDQRNRHH